MDSINPSLSSVIHLSVLPSIHPFIHLSMRDVREEKVDGWMDGWVDGWVDGWMDGWVDGWMDGWMLFLQGLTPFIEWILTVLSWN